VGGKSVARPPYSIDDLLRVMERLRDPQLGCPWDLRQDFASIVPSTLEECYELASAIEHGDFPHVAEELGDVLFQVIFYAQLGRERELFSFEAIVDTLVKKLVRRHPHVFAGGEIEGVVAVRNSAEQVRESWESIKQAEREARSQSGALADVPVALPALPRAQKLQKRAARVNFDWPDARAVLDKLQEELDELREAMAEEVPAAIGAEMGDLLFTCANLARHLGLDAEASLRGASTRFEWRFRHMEASACDLGRALESMTGEELEALWVRAKRAEGESGRDL
jgi:ATP diphosphatase